MNSFPTKSRRRLLGETYLEHKMFKLSSTQWTIGSLATAAVAAAGYHVFMDDRHFHVSDAQAFEERVEREQTHLESSLQLAQATGAVQMQVVAKEGRLHDIERELRNIEIRRASNDSWKGDELRYQKLLDERKALIERLNQLK